MKRYLGSGIVVALAIITSAAATFAQHPHMTYGEMLLTINDQECMLRVPLAYKAEGFIAGVPSVNTTHATKGVHAGYIRCLGEPEKGRTRVIIVIGSNSNDVNAPGVERAKLQERMSGSNDSGGTLKGAWDIKCCNDSLGWTLTISQQDGNNFSGTFSTENSGGIVANGVLRGNTIEFDRVDINGSWRQHWSAQLVNDGGGLRMINGSWTGSYVDRFPGRNNWHAEKRK